MRVALNHETSPRLKARGVFNVPPISLDLKNIETTIESIREELIHSQYLAIGAYLQGTDHAADFNNGKFLFGIKLIDSFLADLQFPLNQKVRIIAELAAETGNAYKKEINRPLEQVLTTKFNVLRGEIDVLLKGAWPQTLESDVDLLTKIFDKKSARNHALYKKLNIITASSDSAFEWFNFISQVLTTTFNAFFQTNKQMQAMMIYDLLINHYRSDYLK